MRTLLATLLVMSTAGPLLAQAPLVLTLDDALRRAEASSESMTIAGAGQSRAHADLGRVDSQRYPQISFAGTYDRTIASEFSGVFDNN